MNTLSAAWWVAAVVGVCSCGRTEVLRYPSITPDAGRDAGVDAGTDADAGTCPPGFARVDGVCVEVAAALDGLRWELPCTGVYPEAPELVCVTHAEVRRETTMRGPPGASFDVTVRVRGVVEARAYFGGMTVAPSVRRGGEPVPSTGDAWNVYRLEVTDPAEFWSLNDGASGEYFCRGVDATFTVRVRVGATVRLVASSVDARRSQIRNRDAAGAVIVPADVPPSPQVYDGQFLQLDVVRVTRAP